MTSNSYKRVVVIKDIESNLIEEAIFILKNDKKSDNTADSQVKSKYLDNKYLLREAEYIINSFLKQSEGGYPAKIEKKEPAKANRNNHRINVLINTGIILCVALLIFLIIKLM